MLNHKFLECNTRFAHC